MFKDWFETYKNDEQILKFFSEAKSSGYSGGFKTWAKEFHSQVVNQKNDFDKVFEEINKLVKAFVTLNGEMSDYMILKKGNEFQTALLVYESDDMFLIGSQLGQVMKESKSDLVVIMQQVVARKIDDKDIESIKNDEVQRELERPIYYPENMRDNLLRFLIINDNLQLVACAKRVKQDNNKVSLLDNEFFGLDTSKDLGTTKELIEGFVSVFDMATFV